MFNEKKNEYSRKQKKEVPVIFSPKYEESRDKAIEIIKAYDTIGEGDFWILMNETKTGKMMYSGLIISHNGCLKLNDTLDSRFDPSCVTVDKDGYRGSLVFTYCNKEQGIYEVGEVSLENCKNAYPYAMGFKRLFDRVVLKLSKLAYAGIYSDSEADEFKAPEPDDEMTGAKKIGKTKAKNLEDFINKKGERVNDVLNFYRVDYLEDLTGDQYADAVMRMG